MSRKVIYLIGSLRSTSIAPIARVIRENGYEAFDDWFSAGPTADDEWQTYETERGHSYAEALGGYAANHTFTYDLHHLNRADAGVLVLPAGKSAHLELGYIIGRDKPGFVLFDAVPERWDVMYKFATPCFSITELIEGLKKV